MKPFLDWLKEHHKHILLIAIPLLAAASVASIALRGDLELFAVGGRNNAVYKYSNDDDFVAVLDVGEAQSVLLHSNSRIALIDTGADAENVLRELGNFGIDRIDYVFISHYHSDHAGGLESVISDYDIGCIVLPKGEPADNSAADVEKTILSLAKRADIPVRFTGNYGKFKVGDFSLKVFQPLADSDNENDRSMAISVESLGASMLIMSDSGAAVEQRLLLDNYDIKSDIVLAGHHGSDDATHDSFLKYVSPKTVIVSCAKSSSYNHPGENFISRVEKFGAELFVTAESGTIRVNFSNGKTNIIKQKN